jgi:uncharacterized protein
VIVLDTTVLVYATGVDHPLRDSCRAIFAAVVDGRLQAATTVEVIQEFAHVRARRRGRVDATALSLDYAELLAPLITVTPEDLRAGLALFATAEALGAFDAVLAATAAARQATAIVSADRAFAGAVPALHYVKPDATGVAELLNC